MNHQEFAQMWINAWNSHDLEDILSHYSDDIEITTPMIAMATGGKESSLKGKEAVRKYWKKALDKFPNLHFDLIHSTAGVDSVALFLFTSAECKCHLHAHYGGDSVIYCSTHSQC